MGHADLAIGADSAGVMAATLVVIETFMLHFLPEWSFFQLEI